MLMKILNVLMTAAFLFSVIVQYNDPDPLVWMTIYGMAGAACVLAILNRVNWIFPVAICVTSLVWAVSLASNGAGGVAISDLFDNYRMKDERVEVAREMGGLLIVAFWMAVLAVWQLRRKKRAIF